MVATFHIDTKQVITVINFGADFNLRDEQIYTDSDK